MSSRIAQSRLLQFPDANISFPQTITISEERLKSLEFRPSDHLTAFYITPSKLSFPITLPFLVSSSLFISHERPDESSNPLTYIIIGATIGAVILVLLVLVVTLFRRRRRQPEAVSETEMDYEIEISTPNDNCSIGLNNNELKGDNEIPRFESDGWIQDGLRDSNNSVFHFSGEEILLD
jgi:hypothetical protein